MVLAGFLVIPMGGLVLFTILRRQQVRRWARIDADLAAKDAVWRAGLAKGGEITVSDLTIESIGPTVVPDVVGQGDTDVSCPCGNLTIGPLTSSGFMASMALTCPECGKTVEQVARRTDIP